MANGTETSTPMTIDYGSVIEGNLSEKLEELAREGKMKYYFSGGQWRFEFTDGGLSDYTRWILDQTQDYLMTNLSK